MAGLGSKLFTDGSVLNAAQVNGYLMDQSIMRFATVTARNDAFGGVGEATLSEGMACYIDADNSLYIYDGANWIKTVSAAQPPAMVLTGFTTFVTNTNPFINGCFTDEFQNYRVMINFQSSVSTNLRMRVRSGVNTPESTNVYPEWGFSVAGGAITNLTGGADSSQYLTATFTDEKTISTFDIFSPNELTRTLLQLQSWNSATGAVNLIAGRINTNTAYTGIELFPDSGNLTGSMRVYGYRNL